MIAAPPRIALLLVLTLVGSGCERTPSAAPASAPVGVQAQAAAAAPAPGSDPFPADRPGQVTIPWTPPNYAPLPPRAPESLTRLPDQERYAFEDTRTFRRLDQDLRAWLGDRRETFYNNDLVSRQIGDGFNGYSELLSAPGGRRLFWGYRQHAGEIQQALIYGRDGSLRGVAVRDRPEDSPRLTIYLHGDREDPAEVAIFRDWSLYMTAYRGRKDSVAEVRIVRLRKR